MERLGNNTKEATQKVSNQGSKKTGAVPNPDADLTTNHFLFPPTWVRKKGNDGGKNSSHSPNRIGNGGRRP